MFTRFIRCSYFSVVLANVRSMLSPVRLSSVCL